MKAGQTVVANENGKRGFLFPVSWEVSDYVRVQANTLEEAYNWLVENMDEIPLGTEPEYIDGSYRVGNIEEAKHYLFDAVNYEKRKAFNIDWDADEDADLPLEVLIPETIFDEEIADYLSNKYGYCVRSYEVKEVIVQ